MNYIEKIFENETAESLENIRTMNTTKNLVTTYCIKFMRLHNIKRNITKFMHDRVADRKGGIEQAKKECMDRKWRLFCHGHPLGNVPGENEASETIEYKIEYKVHDNHIIMYL